MAGKIQTAAQSMAAPKQSEGTRNVTSLMNSLLDKESMRNRFDELLGKRTPQFISSLVSLINATPQLQEVFYTSPMTIIQAALKAAIYDLPIDPQLGYAYIVPFKSKGVPQAQFIMGYKGMQQLAMRTGAYRILNVIDIKEGELKHYNRLTEEIEIDFIEDEDERGMLKIIGYVGYFKLINGMEKTIYMTIKQIEAHEKKHRKGNFRGKGWNDDFESMCAKTVMRRLIGKWGLMSIDYQQANTQTIAAAEAISKGQFDDEDTMPPVDYTIDEDGVIQDEALSNELTDEEKQKIIEAEIREAEAEQESFNVQ